MKTQLDFKNGRPGKLLATMSIPAIIAMVVNGLYYLADAAFVGRGVGSEGLAGLAIVFPMQMFMIAWGSMIGMGTASIISRSLGEKNSTSALETVAGSVMIATVSGVSMAVLTLLFRGSLLNAMGATAETLAPSGQYLSVIACGFPFIFLSMAGFNIARSTGDAKKAGTGMLIGTLINLLLDPVFIFVFHMGVRGAALATVIARILSTLYFIVILRGQGIPLRPRFNRGVIGPIFALGAGNFLSQVCISLVAVTVNRTLSLNGSDTDLAMYGVLSRIHVFITMPLIGLAQGFQPIAGFNYGAGNTERVRGILRITLAASAGIGIVLAALPLAAPGLVMRAFCNDPEVIAAGLGPLRISLLLLPVIGFQITGFSWFQALGKPGKTLILSLSRQLLFLVPLLLILPERFGIQGLWLAFPAADGLAALLSCLLMCSSSRNLRRAHCLACMNVSREAGGREKPLALSTTRGSQKNVKDGII